MAAPLEMAFHSQADALAELITSEERYVKTLSTFRNGFLAEIANRNTDDRRKLYYGHRALSVAYELMHILHAHNQQLLRHLQAAKEGDLQAVAHAFLNFAQAETVYSIYSANAVDALPVVEPKGLLGSLLLKYTREHPVAGGISVPRYLGMPVERFPEYVAFLRILIKLNKGAPCAALEEALKTMETGLKNVEGAVEEYKRQNDLINLQAQFMGYVDLYAPDRRLLKEGTLTKIYIDSSKRKPQERYVHLLSDALIYSSKLIGPYKYKLAKIHSLENIDSAIAVDGDKTLVDVIRRNDYAIRFQAPDEATAKSWMLAITQAATAYHAKLESGAQDKPQQPREARVNAVSFLKKHGLQLDSLPERSRTVVYGVKADLTYIEYLKVFARVVGVTLDELSRGIGAVGGKRGTVENGDLERANGLFETKVKTLSQMTEGTLNRVKAASAGKPLQSCEMAVFLKVLPVLETLSQTLVERLEERLTAHSTQGADFCIGDIYLDMSALFVAYNSYAAMVPEAEKVLAHPALAELALSLEEELAPLTMAQHLAAPMEAAQRMAVQMKAVLEMTPEEHPDRKNLELATIMMEQTASGMQGALADTKNYWRLVEIKDAIASMELAASPLDTLVDANRKLLLEGTLLKACRSKDKAYMFWLFSDALLYATQLPGGMFQLHRWMALAEMNVAGSAQDKTGLDILTAEKSFTVFAKDEAERDMWLRTVADAVVAAKEAAGVSTDPAALQVAPILVQTSDSNDCGICQQPFTFFMRKFHCMACGHVVCDKCSPSRKVLAHIHKTQKQRICNACVAQDDPEVTTSPSAATAAPALASPVVRSPAKSPAAQAKHATADFLASPGLATGSSAKPAQAPSWLAAGAEAEAEDDAAAEEQAADVGNPFAAAAAAASPASGPAVVPAFDALGLAPHTQAEAAAKPQPQQAEQAPQAGDPFDV